MDQNIPNTINQQQLNQMMAIAEIRRRLKNGASNFHWIAGLSLINTIIFLFGGTLSFVVGLGITQLVDGLAFAMARDLPNLAAVLQGFGFLVNLCIAGLFVVFGYFAAKGHRWAFIVGMVLYSLDAVLMLFFKVWLGFGFHLFFLWLLFGGLQALKQLNKLVPQTLSDPAFPQSPTN